MIPSTGAAVYSIPKRLFTPPRHCFFFFPRHSQSQIPSLSRARLAGWGQRIVRKSRPDAKQSLVMHLSITPIAFDRIPDDGDNKQATTPRRLYYETSRTQRTIGSHTEMATVGIGCNKVFIDQTKRSRFKGLSGLFQLVRSSIGEVNISATNR